MPISLDKYTLWATFNRNNEVALSQNDMSPLTRASSQVGVLARFFNTKPAQEVRSAVMDDFTRALSAKYGVTLAREALAAAGLKPTSKLDGKTILAVEGYAHHHRDAKIYGLLFQPSIKLATGTLTKADIFTYNQPNPLRAWEYLKVRHLAVDMLGETPLDQASFHDFCTRCNALFRQLGPIVNTAFPPSEEDNPIERKIYEDACTLFSALSDKWDEVEEMLQEKPLSDQNVTDFKTIWASGALRALNSLRPICSPAMRTAIDTIMQEIHDDPQSFFDTIPLDKKANEAIAKNLFARLTEKAHPEAVPVKEDFLSKLISAGYRQDLNCGHWSVIEKPITVSVGNTPVSLTSTIVPGSRIGAATADGKGPIGETYDPGVNGYMCHCADTKHAVNLAVSSLTVPDEAGNPQTAFRGVRHGVHCAWEISDATKRAEANVKRAEEAVIAAFLADPANMGKIENGEIKLNMTSVSLLTPDVARHIKWGKSSDERLMLREQKAAWDAVSAKGVTFQHNGQTITIRPTVFTFNFGVNAGAVKYGNLAPNLAGGWGMSDDMNLHAYKQMRPLVEDFVKDTTIPQAKRDAVRTLFNQCMVVLKKEGERSDGHDAYKVAARYAVLSHLMGWTPCWNCKSGKDRTGQMDVECKFLATLVARGEPIPEPGAKLTKEQTELLRAIALEGGNFEMQKYNTGLQGFKTSGVDSIPERLGGQEFREFHKGGASAVGV